MYKSRQFSLVFVLPVVKQEFDCDEHVAEGEDNTEKLEKKLLDILVCW